MTVFYLVFVFGLFFVLFYNFYYVFVLLVLELLLLSVFCFFSFLFFAGFGYTSLFVFLLVVVCMGGFSISLLVSIVREFGCDFWFSGFVF